MTGQIGLDRQREVGDAAPVRGHHESGEGAAGQHEDEIIAPGGHASQLGRAFILAGREIEAVPGETTQAELPGVIGDGRLLRGLAAADGTCRDADSRQRRTVAIVHLAPQHAAAQPQLELDRSTFLELDIRAGLGLLRIRAHDEVPFGERGDLEAAVGADGRRAGFPAVGRVCSREDRDLPALHGVSVRTEHDPDHLPSGAEDHLDLLLLAFHQVEHLALALGQSAGAGDQACSTRLQLEGELTAAVR